jgi:hypothetical protein
MSVKIVQELNRRARGRMERMLAKCRERITHEHGWEVPRRCDRCGADSVPTVLGWTPTQAINFGNTPTIYADLQWPKCGETMKEIAGEKLVEMFADERTPAESRQMLALFIAVVAGVPAMFLLLPRSWWTYAMIPYFLLLGPMIECFNGQVHAPRFRCDCGKDSQGVALG